MTIFINGQDYSRSDLRNNTPVFAPSKWDSEKVAYSTTKHFSDRRPVNSRDTWNSWKKSCVRSAARFPIIDYRTTIWDSTLGMQVPNPNVNTQHKGYQKSMVCCNFIPGSIKSNANAYDRTWIALDFDEGSMSAADIQNFLSPYLYFGWTTFSHQTSGKGNRYRFVLLLEETFAEHTEWKAYEPSIEQWAKDAGFSLDKNGSLTYCQLAVMPVINDRHGFIQFFENDGPSTRKLSIKKDIPFIGALTAKPSASTIVKKSAPTKESLLELSPIGDAIVQHILAKPTLAGSANYGERLLIASAGIASGLSDIQIEEIDDHVKAWDAAVPSSDMPTKAHEYEGVRTHYKLTNMLDPYFRAAYAIGASVTSAEIVEEIKEKSIWPTTYEIDGYITEGEFGNASSTLVRAATGTGKTFFWANYEAPVICLVPLRAIADQYNNGTGKVRTYDAAINILKHLEEGEDCDLITEDTILVIDEAHELRIVGFRAEALTAVEKLIKNYEWKRVIFQSATIKPDDFDAYYMFEEKIEVLRQTPITKNYYHVERGAETMTDAVITLAKQSHDAGRKCIVLFSNTSACDGIAVALTRSGIPAVAATAANMRNPHHRAGDMKSADGYCMNEVSVIVGTSCMECGVSIKDEVDDYDVIIAGREPLAYIDQFAGRMRKVSTLNLYHIYNESDKVNVAGYEDFANKFEYKYNNNALSLIAGVGGEDKPASQADKFSTQWVHGMDTSDVMSGGIFFTETNNLFAHGYQSLLLGHAYDTYVDYNNIDVLHENMRYLGFTVMGKTTLPAIADISLGSAKASIARQIAVAHNKVKALVEEFVVTLDDETPVISDVITDTLYAQDQMPIGKTKEVLDAAIALYDVAHQHGKSYEWWCNKFVAGVDVEAIKRDLYRSKSVNYNVHGKFASVYPVGKVLSEDELRVLYEDICQFLTDEVSRVEVIAKASAYRKLTYGVLKDQNAVSFDDKTGKVLRVEDSKIPTGKLKTLFCTVDTTRSRKGNFYTISGHTTI